MPSQLYSKGSTSGAKAQNTEWFASDLTPGLQASKAADFIIEFELATTVQAAGDLEYTTDSGVTWFKLGDGSAAVNTTLRSRVMVVEGDTFNMRSINAGGATVDRCVVVADLDA
jgi:hypothetical protein